MSVAAGVLFVSPVVAQSPEPPQTATEGASGVSASEPVWEPHIAAARPHPTTGTLVNDKIVCVHNVGPRDGQLGVAFSIASNSGGTWSWQAGGLLAPPSGYQTPFDPTLAYNAISGDFVVSVALTKGPTAGYKLGVAHYFPTTNGPFGDGVSLIDPNLYGGPLASTDKPTIVAGEMTTSIQEFYIVTTRVGQPTYLRSTDGGHNWPYAGAIDGTGGVSFVTPCTSPDGKIYVAESGTSTTAFKFFQGTDITNPSDPNFGKVTWVPLETDNVDPPDPLVVPLNAATATRYLPLPSNHWAIRMWPKIAADPLDANILYVVYHDLAAAPSSRPDEDMDVYLRRLTRNAERRSRWMAMCS